MGQKSGDLGVTTRTSQVIKLRKPPSTLQEKRWDRAKILKHKRHSVSLIVARILRNEKRYKKVAKDTGVPWHVIAGLHNMESSGSFSRHLHEGSSLRGRTRDVPKGRPKTGKPPFTWEFSAKDALYYDSMHKVNWKALDSSLYACERYNGTGYLRYHKNVPTPYLWSYSTVYTRGKYIKDGVWSNTAVSKQCGVATIWKMLEEKNKIKFK
jgi:lysozyme family protein